ncbi:MAG: DNA primase [Armatimonadetes bacterium]|nr:DNA primase [Armatimonadota bacterium]
MEGTDLKEEIARRLGIAQVVSWYVHLVHRGKTHKGLCPFHSEKTPSFTVNEEKGFWYCFGCQQGGDLYHFVQKIENISFMEALELLAGKAGLDPDDFRKKGPDRSGKEELYSALSEGSAFFQTCLFAREGIHVRKYLESRGIPESTWKHFGLGFAPTEGGAVSHLRKKGASLENLEKLGLAKKGKSGYYDYFRGRLIFPVKDILGRVIAFGGRVMDEGAPKYLNSPESPVFSKSRQLFALDIAKKAISEGGSVLLVEGYLDAIAAHQSGFTNAVASLGTSLTAGQVGLIGRYARKVLLAYDSDEAGNRASLRALALFQEEEIEALVVTLPKGEDPDSFLREKGPDAFRDHLARALPSIRYVLAQSLKRHDPGTLSGKEEIAKEVLPFIRAFKSPIAQDEHTRLLADTLKVREEALRRLSARFEKKGISGRLEQGHGGVPKMNPEPLEQISPAERELLALILKKEITLDQVFQENGPSDFASPLCRKIVEEIHDLWSTDRSFRLDQFLSTRKDETESSLIARLISESEGISLSEKQKNQLLGQLRERTLRETFKSLQEKMAEFMGRGEHPPKELQMAYKRLEHQLKVK